MLGVVSCITQLWLFLPFELGLLASLPAAECMRVAASK